MAKPVLSGKTSPKISITQVTELKRELKRLVNAIIVEEEEGGECGDEIYERAKETILGLKDLSFKKTPSLKSLDSLEIPQGFICPLSKKVMKDPVVLANGETCDRQFIQARFDAGFRTCPQTGQVLCDTTMVPNNLVREMISQWCMNHGVEVPSPVVEVPSSGQCMTQREKDRFDALLTEVVSPSLSEQKQAARELRSLTKRIPSFRSLFTENTDAIPQLLIPLSMGKAGCPSDLQEDLITTILNLSILEENKKLVADTPRAIPLLLDSVRDGTIETRTNAAAALFSLSALEANKSTIGELGALKPLIDLLEEGHRLAMKDVASAIFSLCLNQENRMRAIREGAVKVIVQKLKDGILVGELLTILAMLSGHQKATEEMVNHGAMPCLLSIIRESKCERIKENSVSILYLICNYDRSKFRDMNDEERAHHTISLLAENGTARARRKATGILDRLKRTGLLTYTA